MNRTRRSRRTSKARNRRVWVRSVVGGFVLLVGVAALVTSIPLLVTSLSPSEAQVPQKVEASIPRPTATQTPTPTPTPTPEPELAPWSFSGARLTIPAAGVDGEMAPLGLADLTPEGDVDPPGKWSIAWYSGFFEEGILSIPSSRTEDAVYVFCHTYAYEPAACNDMDLLQLGDGATLATGDGEALPYTLVDSFEIDRVSFRTDPRIYSPHGARPDLLFVTTCDGDGPRDENGRTINRIVSVFQRVVTKPAEIQPQLSASGSEEFAGRLY